MIEAIMAVALLILIIAALLLLSQKTDNTNWLALKAYAEARLVHYDGKDKEHITSLVTEFGLCCEEIVNAQHFRTQSMVRESLTMPLKSQNNFTHSVSLRKQKM